MFFSPHFKISVRFYADSWLLVSNWVLDYSVYYIFRHNKHPSVIIELRITVKLAFTSFMYVDDTV